MQTDFRLLKLILTCFSLLILLRADAHAQDEALKSRPELTNYEETSRYDDVTRFISELQKRADILRVETFGYSQEGRPLPLMILADPPISQPRDARISGKPIVFIMGNIHAGEVEGKEAAQHLARRIVSGDLRPLLDRIIILIAPIYNADGNEKISLQNRAEQNGPVGGVGRRENSAGLDLNRDYMKLESPEARSLVRLFNRWDPHVTVDLHTTNGSFHGYHLTYSQPLNPSSDPRIVSYHREKMLPVITRAMLDRHKFRTYFYGNFSRPRPGEKDARSWQAFTHAPRIGQNYIGLRNRLTILSEAYSYLDFRGRVKVTEALVEEIFKYSASHGDEIRQLTSRVDSDTVRRTSFQLGVEYEMRPLPKPVDILVGEVTKAKNPRSGADMTVMVEGKFTPTRMLDYGAFVATRSVAAPRAYLFRPEAGMKVVVEKLLAHGVTVEELTAPLTAEVESFVIGEVKRSARAFQGHNEVRLKGSYKKETMEFPAGTVLVRSAQPLSTLASYLLEPESDDGLAAWNFLDAYLETGKVYPVYKAMQDVKASGRVIERQ